MISKIYCGIELVQIDLISLDTNDDNSKRTRVQTNRYTDNYNKHDKKEGNRKYTKQNVRRKCKSII